MDGVVVPPHLCQWWELDPPNAAVVLRAEDAARGTSKRPRKEEEEVDCPQILYPYTRTYPYSIPRFYTHIHTGTVETVQYNSLVLYPYSIPI